MLINALRDDRLRTRGCLAADLDLDKRGRTMQVADPSEVLGTPNGVLTSKVQGRTAIEVSA